MRADRLPLSVCVLLVKGLMLFLLSLGTVACGGDESSRSGQSVASAEGGEATADRSPTGLDRDAKPREAELREGEASDASDTSASDTSASDTVQQPTPIDVGDGVEFETVQSGEPSPSEGSPDESSPDEGESPGSENTGSGSSNASPSPPDDPPDPGPVQSTLEFTTDPEQATVTIENQETGTRRTKSTPATFEVPPGLYSWTVEKEGYASKESRQAINLRTQRQAADTVSLVSVSGEGSYLKRADGAYDQEKYQQAITFYRQVPEPSADQDPTDYLSAQTRLGRIHWQERGNYEAAIQAYQKVIEYDNTRYEAFLNLARIHFETERYEEVLNNLDRVSELKYRIPAQNQKRQRITLRSQYLRGRTLLQLAKNEQTRNRRAKALRANQAFQGFLSTIPPALESTFSQERQEAKQKRDEVRTLLNEEIR